MKGPTVTINRSCWDCDFCESIRYKIQGDSGSEVFCNHPSTKARAYIGDTDWTTPRWCPEWKKVND